MSNHNRQRRASGLPSMYLKTLVKPSYFSLQLCILVLQSPDLRLHQCTLLHQQHTLFSLSGTSSRTQSASTQASNVSISCQVQPASFMTQHGGLPHGLCIFYIFIGSRMSVYDSSLERNPGMQCHGLTPLAGDLLKT